MDQWKEYSREDHISQVNEAFRQAEEALKKIEVYAEDIAVPALNEFRYGFNHLLRGLACDEEFHARKNLDEAIGHCRRATYDCAEVGLLFLIEETWLFEEEFDDLPIAPVLPRWTEHLEKARECQAFLAEAGSADAKEERDSHADECFRLFGELQPLVAQLKPARDELKKVASARDRDELRWRRGLQLTALGIVVAAFLGIARLLSS